MIFFFAIQSSAQRPNQDYIIRTRGDTLTKYQIKMKSPYPDKNLLIAKIKKKKTRIYRPKNITSYYHDNKYYQSLPLTGKRRAKKGYVRKLIDGDLSLYITLDKGIKQLYLQKEKGDIKLIPWKNYDKFVHKKMDNFKKFNSSMETQKKEKFFYDEYSMVDYISRYNSFINPEVYTPTSIPFLEEFKIGAYAAIMGTKLKLPGNTETRFNGSGYGYTVGINITKYYTPLYAFNFSFTINQQFINFNLEESFISNYTIKIRSIQTPTYIHFEGYLTNKIKWYAEIGGFIKVPIATRIVKENGDRLGLTSDIRLAPFGGLGAIIRFKNQRKLFLFLRGDSYQQRLLDNSPLPANFIPINSYRYYDLSLIAKMDI